MKLEVRREMYMLSYREKIYIYGLCEGVLYRYILYLFS